MPRVYLNNTSGRIFLIIWILGIATFAQAQAQNSMHLKECILEPVRLMKSQAGDESYKLRLNIRCTLASQEVGILKVAIDPEEIENFKTVAEKRVRQGKSLPIQLEIPIQNWKTEKLTVIVMLQDKNPELGQPPLANVIRTFDKSAFQ